MLSQEQPEAYGPAPAAPAALTSETINEQIEGHWHLCRIDRATLRGLTKRSDAQGLTNFGIWLFLLIASGYAGALTWGSWLAVPAFFIYGTLYSSSDARWHECAHGTPFRRRWLNEGFYHLASFMALREAYLWRWNHARHHTHTIIPGRDPEIQVPRPANLARICFDFFHLFDGPNELRKIGLHALGIVTPEAQDVVPKREQRKMIWSSRAYVALVGGVAGLSLVIGSLLPMMYILLPRFYCAWHHQLCSLTQHAGLAENVRDHRLNTRTVEMAAIHRFLYVNMNYHIEHHMFPMVPFHGLARLHATIEDQLPRTYTSMSDAYREILPALIRQSRDPLYFVHRKLPAEAPGS